jgi:hypothetical protein
MDFTFAPKGIGLRSEQTVIARHAAIASKSFWFMVFFKTSSRENRSTL